MDTEFASVRRWLADQKLIDDSIELDDVFRQMASATETLDIFPALMAGTRPANKRALADLDRAISLGSRIQKVGRAWLLLPNRSSLGGITRKTAVVSSRVGKQWQDLEVWLAQLRLAASRLQVSRESLLISERSTTAPFLDYLSQVFESPVIRISKWPKKVRLFDVLHRDENQPAGHHQVFVLNTDHFSSLDEIEIELADDVRCLFARSGGVIEKNLTRRLQKDKSERADRNVFVSTVIPDSLRQHARRSIDDWLDRGAIGWHVIESEQQKESISKSCDAQCSLDNIDHQEFLHHFTRPRKGTWVNQSTTQMMEELFFSPGGQGKGSVATLLRMLVQKRIVANNQLSADQGNVCCFTAASLHEFHRLKTFRSHLSRWDFLPFGISIRKSVMESLGAEPVMYLEDGMVDERENRWRHQPARTQTAKGNEIDWTVEQEWRVRGDIDLAKIDPCDCFVFVGDETSRRLVQSHTSFDVVVMPGPS